jgi:transcription elongation factor GreA
MKRQAVNRQAANRDDPRSRLQAELAQLESSERPRLLVGLGSGDGRDLADQAQRIARELELAQIDHRIDRVRTRLAALDEVPSPSPDGLGIGTSVVIDLGDGPETYRLARFSERGVPTITPDSPLGTALRGVRPGQTVRFRTPGGESTVTLLAVGEPGEAVA